MNCTKLSDFEKQCPNVDCNTAKCPIFRKVVIPSNMGSDEEGQPYAPENGAYENALVYYEASGVSYIYSSDGIYTKIAQITGGQGEVISVNGKKGVVTITIDELDGLTADQIVSRINSAKAEDKAYTDAKIAQVEADIPTKTSDLTNDSRFQNDTQVANAIAPVSTKIDTVDAAINKNVVNSVGITANSSTDTLNLTDGKINIKTGTTTSEAIPFPVASATSAGVMNSATYQGLVNVTDIANGLLEGAVAVSGLSEEPTQTQVSNAWKTATGRTTLMNRAVVYDVTNQKLWTYYTNTTTWYPVTAGGSVDVQPWTNTQAGIVKGSTIDGQIFAENDGTGSVNGWDEVKTGISNLENAGYQTESQVDTKIANTIFADGAIGKKVQIADTDSVSQITIGNVNNPGLNEIILNTLGQKYGAAQNGVSIGAFSGPGCGASAQNAMSIGSFSVASGTDSIALGSYSAASAKGEFSVGGGDLGVYGKGYNNTGYRKITNVYDGENAHDAATLAQGNTLASSAPTTSTVGVVGQLYTDTSTGKLYHCTAVSGSTYTWEAVGGSSGGGDPVYSTVQTSNSATGGAVYIGNKNANQEIVEDPSTSDAHKQYFWALPQGEAATVAPANHTVNILGGKPSTVWGGSENSVYIGYQVSDYFNSNGIGIGAYSQPWGAHSIALGAHADTNQKQNSIALGYYAKNNRDGEISFETQNNLGYNKTNYKIVAGVYDGQEAHDAVNKQQLDAALAQIQALEARIAALEGNA